MLVELRSSYGATGPYRAPEHRPGSCGSQDQKVGATSTVNNSRINFAGLAAASTELLRLCEA